MVTIPPRIESEDRPEEQTNRRLVRNDTNHFASMLAHRMEQGRHGPCGHGQPGLPAIRGEVVGVGLPFQIHVAELRLGLPPGESLPHPVVDLEKTGHGLHRQIVRLGQNPRGLHRPVQRRGITCRDRLIRQALRQRGRLLPADIAQFHIRGPREPVFRGKHGGPVTDQKHPCLHASLLTTNRPRRKETPPRLLTPQPIVLFAPASQVKPLCVAPVAETCVIASSTRG